MPTSLTTLPHDTLTEIADYLSERDLYQLKATASFFKPAVNAALVKKLSREHIKQIATGDNHTLFLQHDGSVWGCGENYEGELGIGHYENQPTLVRIPIEQVQRIIAGGQQSLFIKKDGSVWGCGENYEGQLGLGCRIQTPSTPVRLPIDQVQDFSAGGGHSLFLKPDGSVWGCGCNGRGQLGIDYMDVDVQYTLVRLPIDQVQQISAGDNHTLFLKMDGSVWGFGSNDAAQLGIDSTVDKSYTPVRIPIDQVQQIIAKGACSLFIKIDGSVWGCGDNMFSQLGMEQDMTTQSPPAYMSIDQVQQISAGGAHTLFFKMDGSVWGCGFNSDSRLGIASSDEDYESSPIQIPIDQVKQISTGSSHTVFLKTDGSIWVCGKNKEGQLGLGYYHKDDSSFTLQLLPKYQKLAERLQKLKEPVLSPPVLEDISSPSLKLRS